MIWSFEDKLALVTGAGASVGLAPARTFAEAGAGMVLADLREASARAAAEKLVGAGHQAVAIGCDIADDAQVAAMVDRIVVTFGRLDAAFNTAGGISPHAETVNLGNGARDRVTAAGLRGISNCTKHELRQMRRQGGGAIVNCACIGGLAGCLGLAGSIASTRSAEPLTRTAAMDLAAKGTRVTAIYPGPISAPVLGEPCGDRACRQAGRDRARRPVAMQPVGALRNGHALAVDGAMRRIDGGAAAGALAQEGWRWAERPSLGARKSTLGESQRIAGTSQPADCWS